MSQVPVKIASEDVPNSNTSRWSWTGPQDAIITDPAKFPGILLHLDRDVFAVEHKGLVGISDQGEILPKETGMSNCLAFGRAIHPEQFGSAEFRSCYGVKYAYVSGAMAQGIASTELVIQLGKANMLGVFGAAGMAANRLEGAIQNIQSKLPNGPYAFNLIHSPHEEAMERMAVELYLRYGVKVVEASAFLDLTSSLVWYRAAGLSLGENGKILIKNRIIAKLSRSEVALKFMQPAPAALLQELVLKGRITQEQARLAAMVPVADDITVEADSGGHTDNRPLVCLLPGILSLRDEVMAKYQYPELVRVGAGGGISTPAAALAAYIMGAAYVVTGSVNQACVEAGTSDHTRKLLAEVSMADVMMAPSADMFEMGVKVQVLKKGTLFPMRAQKLYELYTHYDSIETLPTDEREKLEKQIFRRSLEDVWDETIKFFKERDPEQIQRANQNPKRKMALIFRWYLGLSSKWSNTGEPGREMDYQIWCGPAMGAFNDWVRGTYLADYTNRHVADVAMQLMIGAAYLWRCQELRQQGIPLPASTQNYRPNQKNVE